MSRRISGLGALLGLLLLASACQAYFASPPAGQEVPTAVVSPPAGQTRPTEVSPPMAEAYPPPQRWTPEPTATPGPFPTPLTHPPVSPPLPFPTIYIPPPPPEVQPTAYIPEGPLPPNFPPVAYTAHGSVWILRYENGLLREEFLAGPFEGQPLRMALSPDGERLALNMWHPYADMIWMQLFLLDLDGHVQLLCIPEHCNETTFCAWSPDSSEVLVSMAGFSGGLLHADKGTFRQIVLRPTSPIDCEGGTLSPDGRYIFCSGGPNPFVRVEINEATLDKVEVLLSQKPANNFTRAYDFVWSPVLKRAAFIWNKMFEFHPEGRLWLMDADGSNLRPLGRDDTYDFDPAWSPDGKTIAFARRENPVEFEPVFDPAALTSSLWLIDVESGEEHLLLSSEGQFAHWSPEWLPDGSGLVFLSDRGGEANLYFVRPDGSGLLMLTHQGGLNGEIAILR